MRQCSVNIGKEMETAVASPQYLAPNASTSRRKHGKERTQRSRSSPVRSCLSGVNSPDGRARSPSISTLRVSSPLTPAPVIFFPNSMLYNYSSNAPGAVAYFSPHPPSEPMYLIPLPPNPAPVIDAPQACSRMREPQIKHPKRKESKKIVRQLLRSLLRGIALTVAARPISPENEVCNNTTAGILSTKLRPLYRNVSSQTMPRSAFNRQSVEYEDDFSTSSEYEEVCEWAGDVRALRDSHVRLVLRQLKHLRDIERLNRTLHRAHISVQ